MGNHSCDSEWEKYVDEASGAVYYYNARTDKSVKTKRLKQLRYILLESKLVAVGR